ncbi:hypothetical protein ACP3VU_14340 [Vibrio sp. PNB23_22_6]|uniref:hypothetical protein n=1 Tax=Vibrio TaxID=662 RepID=UPI001BF0B9C2|nr:MULTISPECIES: hypothetical protein [Vibrio]BBM66923.1 hypothetical protein VA249_35690 [Vibrio alfacsensis]
MKLKIYFKALNCSGFELASYDTNNDSIIAQWLSAGIAKKRSSFYLVLYDDNGDCLDAKYLSKEVFSRLLIEWDCFGIRRKGE